MENEGKELVDPLDKYLLSFPERMRALSLAVKICNDSDDPDIKSDLPRLIGILLDQSCEQVDWDEKDIPDFDFGINID